MKVIEVLAFGGPGDMTLIFLAILLLFGAKKLPELARGLGQAMREFNKAKDEIEKELTKPTNEVTAQPAPNKQEYTLNPAPAAPVAQASAPAPAPPQAQAKSKEETAPQVTTQPLL